MRSEENLKLLSVALERLVNILRLDPECNWLPKFRRDLSLCRRLLEKGYSQSDLSELSASIRHVYQGMGSFNDYEPAIYDPVTGRYSSIPGTEEFEKITNDVYELGMLLLRPHE